MKNEKLNDMYEMWTELIVLQLTTTDKSYEAIARESGCSTGTVYRIARRHGLRRQADKVVSNG